MDKKTAREIAAKPGFKMEGGEFTWEEVSGKFFNHVLKFGVAIGFLEGYHQGRRELINDPRIKNLWFAAAALGAPKNARDFEQLKKEMKNG